MWLMKKEFYLNQRRALFSTRFIRLTIVFPSILILMGCGAPRQAKKGEGKPDSSLLTLERLFDSSEFVAQSFGPAQWLKDGSGYSVLEPSKDAADSQVIVRYDLESGQRTVLVPAARLRPSPDPAPVKIADYAWSPDGKYLLIEANTKRDLHKTFADYWVLNIIRGDIKKLGGKAEPSSLLNAAFSPDGQKIAYVYKNNIFVEDVSLQEIFQLTKDGSDVIFNGTFDHPYEEESFTANGFRWSPDSKFIAYSQLNSEKVPTFYMINTTDSLYPKLVPFKWTKPGETNPACRIGVLSAAGGETRWFQVPGDPSNNYIQQLDWAANSAEVVFQHLNRLQNQNELMLGDARTGLVKKVFTDTDPRWVELVRNFQWLDQGQKFIWVSEKDGWRHVYLISRSGKDVKFITPGEFDVESIARVDEKGGWLYYIASPDNPIQKYLYRVPLDGSGKVERLSPADRSGTHSYVISPDAKWAFQTYSTFCLPPTVKLVRLPEHKDVRTLVDNAKLREKFDALKRGQSEFFRVDIGGGVSLDAWSMKPPGFNPKQKYPVLFYVYGEPMGTTVTDNWGGNRYLWHLMLTQHGYIVMSVENRGTRVPRGREWRKIIYGQIGILASADQAAAVQAIIKRWKYVDPDRIGVWGHSGGGAMTLNMMFRYPDLYRTGIASAPVAHQRYYDSIYQERFMGLPKGNPEGYEKGSPLNFAHQLKGNLLIIHGTGDHNVHYQHAEMLINELVKNNKPFSIMLYPNRTHGITEGTNTVLHRHTLMTRYLKENLPPGPK